MIHAFTQHATPALRAWLDNNSGAVDDVAGRYQRVYDALHGRTTISEPLPLSDWKDIDGVWRALLLDADVNPQIVVDTLIVPVALAARGRGDDDTAMPEEALIRLTARVMGMIATRDRKLAREWLHASNKTSLRVFKRLTGYAKPDDWFASVGFDLDAERREAEAARAAAAERERAQATAQRKAARSAKDNAKLDALIRYRAPNGKEQVAAVREFIDTVIGLYGYRTIEPQRDGITTVYWIRDEDGNGYALGGTVERDYALDRIEALTGTRPVVPALLPITTYTQHVGGWSLPKPVNEILADTLRKGKGAYSFSTGKQREDRKKDAIEVLDRWAREYAAAGSRVIEQAVIVYDGRDGKTYLPAIVVERRED